MINVLWLTSDKLGCGTYRCYMPALSLQDAKIADSNFLFHDQVSSVEKVIKEDLDGIDVVVFQRAVGTAYVDLMKHCRENGIATAFEMDDNLFDVPRHNPAAWYWRRKAVQRILRQEIGLADLTLVSTRPLQQTVIEAMNWKQADKIRVCMNHLHPAVWGKQVWGQVLPYHNQHIVIGWQGSTTHDTDFKQALPALWKILEEFPNVLLRFLGCVPMSVKGVIPEARFQWTKGVEMERYPSTLRYVNFDIGIAPITDSLFNQSKSNIKWLEYSALGLPSVCSRVYPYEKSITDGENGYVATSSDEWYEKLRALVVDADLRRRIGTQAQAHVWREWSYDTHGPRWAEAFSSVVTPRPSLDQIINGEVPCSSSPTQAENLNPSTSSNGG